MNFTTVFLYTPCLRGKISGKNNSRSRVVFCVRFRVFRVHSCVRFAEIIWETCV